MKKLLLFLTAILTNCIIFAQIPQTISWQGILQDANGNNLNGTYNISVDLYDAGTGGNHIWSETHSNVTVSNGLVNLELGKFTPLPNDFSIGYWLAITVGNGTQLPRIKLNSVPYAMFAKNTSNEWQGIPFVLKDNEGKMRFILDPNYGTFAILVNDIIWYSIDVNSPPEIFMKNTDGTTTIQKGDGDYSIYYPNGIAKENFINSYNPATNTTTQLSTKADETGTVREQVKIEENFDGIGTTTTTTSNKYDEDGKLVESVVEENKKSGALGIDETTITKKHYHSDGTLYYDQKTVDNNKDKKNSVYYYDKTTGQWTAIVSSPSNLEYQSNYNNSLNFTPLQSGYGWMLSLNSNYQNNPFVTFSNNEYGGYTRFGGESLGITSEYGFAAYDFDVYGNSMIGGDLNVNGNKNFRIDHPDDPENKDLYHSCIESDEVLNQYTGNTVTNENGLAIVILADYVQKINIDFRYQLTVIGQFAQAIISKEINNNQFEIQTDKPNVKVSWLITAKRNDKYMQENPFEPVRLKNKKALNRIELLKNNK